MESARSASSTPLNIGLPAGRPSGERIPPPPPERPQLAILPASSRPSSSGARSSLAAADPQAAHLAFHFDGMPAAPAAEIAQALIGACMKNGQPEAAKDFAAKYFERLTSSGDDRAIHDFVVNVYGDSMSVNRGPKSMEKKLVGEYVAQLALTHFREQRQLDRWSDLKLACVYALCGSGDYESATANCGSTMNELRTPELRDTFAGGVYRTLLAIRHPVPKSGDMFCALAEMTRHIANPSQVASHCVKASANACIYAFDDADAMCDFPGQHRMRQKAALWAARFNPGEPLRQLPPLDAAQRGRYAAYIHPSRDPFENMKAMLDVLEHSDAAASEAPLEDYVRIIATRPRLHAEHGLMLWRLVKLAFGTKQFENVFRAVADIANADLLKSVLQQTLPNEHRTLAAALALIVDPELDAVFPGYQGWAPQTRAYEASLTQTADWRPDVRAYKFLSWQMEELRTRLMQLHPRIAAEISAGTARKVPGDLVRIILDYVGTPVELLPEVNGRPPVSMHLP